MYLKLKFSLLLLVSGIGFCAAQDFYVEIGNDSILMGNPIEIKFYITNLQGNFEAPSFEDFEIVVGPNASTSYKAINGVFSSSQTYSYFILPKDIGVFTIPPAYFIAKEQTLETMPFEIQVFPNPDDLEQDNSLKTGTNKKEFFNPLNEEVKPEKSSRKIKKI